MSSAGEAFSNQSIRWCCIDCLNRHRLSETGYGTPELLRFGKDNRYMCSPYANMCKPPLEAFVIQLREARAEWRRRYPKPK